MGNHKIYIFVRIQEMTKIQLEIIILICYNEQNVFWVSKIFMLQILDIIKRFNNIVINYLIEYWHIKTLTAFREVWMPQMRHGAFT